MDVFIGSDYEGQPVIVLAAPDEKTARVATSMMDYPPHTWEQIDLKYFEKNKVDVGFILTSQRRNFRNDRGHRVTANVFKRGK